VVPLTRRHLTSFEQSVWGAACLRIVLVTAKFATAFIEELKIRSAIRCST